MQIALGSNTDFAGAKFTLNETIQTQGSVLFSSSKPIYKTSLLSWLAEQLKIRQGIDNLAALDTLSYTDGIEVIKIQQYFKSIRVEHGSIKATAHNGMLASMQLEFYPLPDTFSIQPIISEEDALYNAMEAVNAEKYMWQGYTGTNPDYFLPKGELVIVEDILNTKGRMCLAYKFNIYAETPLSRSWIYIHAASGAVVYTDAIIKHANVTGTASATRYSGVQLFTTDNAGTIPATPYRLRQTRNGHAIQTLDYDRRIQSGGNDALAIDFVDNNNTWTTAENSLNYDDAGLDVQFAMQYISDYWKLVHNRNSWNNANGIMRSYVHIRAASGLGYDNAFWNGASMYYGDGSYYSSDGLGSIYNAKAFKPLTSLDVSAHELGHAVCQTTANLAYNRESGAMNEGFSDIWAACAENYSGLSKQYFLVGEEIGTFPLRSMSEPNLYDQPDTYNGTNWYPSSVAACPTPNPNTNDNCGVHYNSGVLNYWFYLLVNGGIGTNDFGNAFNIAPVGFTKAERITYLTETNLTSSSNYAACRTASINAATTLYGACSVEVEAVTRAWYAVGVGAAFVPCAPQIGFKDIALSVSENAGTGSCPATKQINIRMMVEGVAPTGGNATTMVTVSGTATNGIDYTIATGTATFNAGSSADQNIVLTIIDDGAVETAETIQLDFTVTQNGSNATKTNTNTKCIITINDDDKAPENGTTPATYTAGTYNAIAGYESPFRSYATIARSQFLYTAAELTAAGVLPNVAINGLTFDVLAKNSSVPFTGFTISMANSTRTTMNAAFLATGMTTVYSNNYSTTSGLNTINFTTPFTWNGVDGIVINVCYSNTAFGIDDDYVKGYISPTNSNYITSFSELYTAGSGCGLGASYISYTKPVTGFIQTLAASSIESALNASRTWQVNNNTNTYFYSVADGELIARIANSTNDLGCVTASVSAAGNGTAPLAGFAGVNRSVKEITLSPTTNGSTANYDATVYFKNSELTGITASTALLVKTNAATDASISDLNTVITAPILVTGDTYTGFVANFTGFSRFFLIDANVVLPANSIQLFANADEREIALNWFAAQPVAGGNFTILRSYDGYSFETIGSLASVAETNKYAFLDNAFTESKTIFYRLRLKNPNGIVAYSNTASVNLHAGSLPYLTPNPATNMIQINFGKLPLVAHIKIYNSMGQAVYIKTLSKPTTAVTLPINTLPKGTYFIQLLTGATMERLCFIKQ